MVFLPGFLSFFSVHLFSMYLHKTFLAEEKHPHRTMLHPPGITEYTMSDKFSFFCVLTVASSLHSSIKPLLVNHRGSDNTLQLLPSVHGAAPGTFTAVPCCFMIHLIVLCFTNLVADLFVALYS